MVQFTTPVHAVHSTTMPKAIRYPANSVKFRDPKQWEYGNWLFDWCVANCRAYKIQGVIFGDRQWFSEMAGGRIQPRRDGEAHYNHAYIELNADGPSRG